MIGNFGAEIDQNAEEILRTAPKQEKISLSETETIWLLEIKSKAVPQHLTDDGNPAAEKEVTLIS